MSKLLRCKGKTESGKRCKHKKKVSDEKSSSGFICPVHLNQFDNQTPDKGRFACYPTHDLLTLLKAKQVALPPNQDRQTVLDLVRRTYR